jgi:hypothetical protein
MRARASNGRADSRTVMRPDRFAANRGAFTRGSCDSASLARSLRARVVRGAVPTSVCGERRTAAEMLRWAITAVRAAAARQLEMAARHDVFWIVRQLGCPDRARRGTRGTILCGGRRHDNTPVVLGDRSAVGRARPNRTERERQSNRCAHFRRQRLVSAMRGSELAPSRGADHTHLPGSGRKT